MILIMHDTQRNDLMKTINNVIGDKDDQNSTYLPYILDPSLLIEGCTLLPGLQFTSHEYMISWILFIETKEN